MAKAKIVVELAKSDRVLLERVAELLEREQANRKYPYYYPYWTWTTSGGTSGTTYNAEP